MYLLYTHYAHTYTHTHYVFITTLSFRVINMLERHVFCRCRGPRNMLRFSTRASNENVPPRHWRLLRGSDTSREIFHVLYLAVVSSQLYASFWRATHTFLRNVTFAFCRAHSRIDRGFLVDRKIAYRMNEWRLCLIVISMRSSR